MRLDSMTRQMTQLSTRQLAAAREASTGARIGAPSDDPVAAAQAARVQAAFDGAHSYRTAIRNARGDVELSESTLATATDLVQRAHEIAMQGANGALNASDRSALALEVKQLREQMLTLANTKGTQGYLFGGTASTTAPFDPLGNFTGNGNDRLVEVAPNVPVSVSTNGAMAFTVAGGNDVFAELASLQAALETNNVAAISPSVNALDTTRRQVLAARLQAGTQLERLDSADTAHEVGQGTLTSQRHELVDADPAQSYSRLAAVQQSIEQAISVARTTLATLAMNRFG